MNWQGINPFNMQKSIAFMHVPDNLSSFPPIIPSNSPLVTVSLFLISMSSYVLLICLFCWLGTCIKDTWTKPKGNRINGGQWRWLGWETVVGGNGDNCSWTAIKTKCEKKERKGKMENVLWIFRNHVNTSRRNVQVKKYNVTVTSLVLRRTERQSQVTWKWPCGELTLRTLRQQCGGWVSGVQRWKWRAPIVNVKYVQSFCISVVFNKAVQRNIKTKKIYSLHVEKTIYNSNKNVEMLSNKLLFSTALLRY